MNCPKTISALRFRSGVGRGNQWNSIPTTTCKLCLTKHALWSCVCMYVGILAVSCITCSASLTSRYIFLEWTDWTMLLWVWIKNLKAEMHWSRLSTYVPLSCLSWILKHILLYRLDTYLKFATFAGLPVRILPCQLAVGVFLLLEKNQLFVSLLGPHSNPASWTAM